MTITRIKNGSGGNAGAYLVHTEGLDIANLPTAPSQLPSNPHNGDILIETFSNDFGIAVRAVIRWQYNGTTWVKVGDIEYNNVHLLEEIPDVLDLNSLPTEPVNQSVNISINYVPWDSLHEEYNNGYIAWYTDGISWSLRYVKVFKNTGTKFYHHTTFNISSEPTGPISAPTSPETEDVVIDIFDNLTGNERALIRWQYNGTTWVKLGHTEYSPLHFFDVISADLDVGGLPTAPVNFSTSISTSYVPGDTLWEEYDDGYIYWYLSNSGTWEIGSAKEFSTGTFTGSKVTIATVTSFNNNAVPSSPSTAPVSPNTDDIHIETYNNGTGTQRVIIRWKYNGTTWVMNGTPEYNIRSFHAVVVSSFNPLSLPATPVTPGDSSSYITGDTLREEYTNGYIDWVYATSSWTFRHSRVVASIDTDTNTKLTISHQSSFNSASVPTSPVSPPVSPLNGDTLIETFDNTNGDSRVVMFWTYNGSSWVMTADTEYNVKTFNVSVGASLSSGSLPTTPNSPGTSSDYLPGDTMHEEYNNGYMRWVHTTSGWTATVGRIYTTNNLVTIAAVSSFNMNSLPTSPTSAPSTPKTGDVVINIYNNTNRNAVSVWRWTYNGSSWVAPTNPEYNTRRFYATVASNLTAGALPSTPATPGSSTGYVTGDNLLETYNNGHLEWTYATSSWTLSASRVNTNNTYIVKSAVNWDENGTPPTTPNSPPSSPLVNDVLIQSYDNTTRNNAVTRYWSYNGSAWVALTNGIHRFNMVFTNAPAVTMTYGVAPTASLAATSTSYVNGDILWEKYTNGYGLYKFNNGSWALQTYGLEVGRIQDAADFQATLGAGVDGYYLIYDHDIQKFTLSAT